MHGFGARGVCLIMFGKHGPPFKQETTHQDGRCAWLYWTFKLYCANMSRTSLGQASFSDRDETRFGTTIHHSSHPRRNVDFQHPMASTKRALQASSPKGAMTAGGSWGCFSGPWQLCWPKKRLSSEDGRFRKLAASSSVDPLYSDHSDMKFIWVNDNDLTTTEPHR